MSQATLVGSGSISNLRTPRKLAVAFYSETPDVTSVFMELHLQGFRRATAIERSADDRIRIRHLGAGRYQWALLLLALGILAGLVLGGGILLVASLGALGLLTGWLVGRRLGSGVAPGIVKKYQRWVLRDETLILVETPERGLEQVLGSLRRASHSFPALFFERTLAFERRSPYSERREPIAGERLRRAAVHVAETHSTVPPGRGRDGILRELEDYERRVRRVTADLSESVKLEQPISPAAEWLLDNGYVIQAHILDIRRNLPRHYPRLLPRLALKEAGSKSEPFRVQQVARELVRHTDSQLSRDTIVPFMEAYQSVSPLSIAELWVLPLMFRLALLEDLQHRAIAVDQRQHEREQVDFWANRLLQAAHRDPDQLMLVLAELARRHPVLRPHFAVRLIGHLRDEEATLAPVQKWIERELDAPLADIIRQEQARQTFDKVSIANAITSLRYLAETDWRDLFEMLSRVEKVLRGDPAGLYRKSDFVTRDRCRQAVEQIARRSAASEEEVARRSLDLASSSGSPGRKQHHVGHYLIGEGRPALETSVGYRIPAGQRVMRLVYRHPTLIYLGAIGLFTAAITILALLPGASFSWLTLLLLALAAFPASSIAVQITNYLISLGVPPRVLAKLSFKKRPIPDEFKTLVVVPVLLNPDSVSRQLERMEANYLGNRGANLLFGLLSDFPQAPTRSVPEDEPLFAMLREGIEALNRKYGDHFFLFHRKRVWSESEKSWIGWERKRGKLEELNCLLTGSRHPAETVDDDSYGPKPGKLLRVGDAAMLDGVRFVLTLDADTHLPPSTARRLVETLAHPLNRPEVSVDARRVVSGYAIIQPRVSALLPDATATRFTRLFTNRGGTDPYTPAVSDAYQDLFGDSIYHGKAIYDLQAFHTVLTGRFPDHTLLSHDLIEGSYLRVGLASDIEILESVPLFYHAWANRLHRWIRGDWQVGPWILPRVRTRTGKERNPLPAISRWKLLDNLIRSVVPIASLALLVIAWLWSVAPITLTLLVAASVMISALIPFFHQVISRARGRRIPWRQVKRQVFQVLASASLLPHLAWISADAITRTLYRMVISRSHLLEWETAQVSHGLANRRLNSLLVSVGLISLVAALLGGVISRSSPAVIAAAGGFVLLWVFSPVVAHLLSSDVLQKPEATRLPDRDVLFLRSVARQTWRYFDDFVGPETNWLPPDNSQEALRVEVANRTSPTNIGLWLLAASAAKDFGYLTVEQTIDRLHASLETISRLDRYEGHLFNWYDTTTLEPLRPPYVSTVDSGNLLGCYIALEQACRETTDEALASNAALKGLADTISLIPISAVRSSPRCSGVYDLLIQLIKEEPSPAQLGDILRQAQAYACELLREMPDGSDGEARYWAAQAEKQAREWAEYIDRHYGWMPQLLSICHELQERDEPSLKAQAEEVEEKLRSWWEGGTISLRFLADEKMLADLSPLLHRFSSTALPPDQVSQLQKVASDFQSARRASVLILKKVERVIEMLDLEMQGTKLGFLYDPERRLFSIGYNPSLGTRDSSFYDLLASEARLASLIAVSRGEVPVGHWFVLGRPYGSAYGHTVLLSWSGTMFEYLMPLLFTKSYRHSLLDEACREAVQTQIDYAKRNGIPWGMSESAFSALDSRQIYQYRAFGVPGLALRREPESPPVVAPYASALALLVDPEIAVRNLRVLEEQGLRGDRGYYEAMDYTREAERGGRRGVPVFAYMAHHQAMTFLAIHNVLHERALQRQFHSSPLIRAVETLLFEAIPASPPLLLSRISPQKPTRLLSPVSETRGARVYNQDTPVPQLHLDSNRNYSLMVTNSGGGYSRWRDFDLTRWRDDGTRDAYGSFCYIRDVENGYKWSTSFHPLDRPERRYSVRFTFDRVEFRRRDYEIETFSQVLLSPEDDAEIRLVTLTNRSSVPRRLELTSCLELALSPHRADTAHPAFQNLFVQTEALPERRALLAWRRLRSPEEPPVWAAHLLTGPLDPDTLEYETNRSNFVGRGGTLRSPRALASRLSGDTGCVIDPMFSLRGTVTLPPGERITISFVTLAAESRDQIMQLIDKYQEHSASRRALDVAWTYSQLQFRFLGIQTDQAHLFQELASHMVYPSNRLRPPPDLLRRNLLGQSRLWGYGISGDLPVLLMSVSDLNDLANVREALLAHAFWRIRGLRSDFLILTEESTAYERPLEEQIRRLIQMFSIHSIADQPGGVYLRSTDQIPKEDLDLLFSIARIHLIAARGSLLQQLTQSETKPASLPPALEITRYYPEEPSSGLPFLELKCFNGLGGFYRNGQEYAIYLGHGDQAPAPWSNVNANSRFGSLVTETGMGSTWCENSQSNRLTPWRNDPLTSVPSDVVYIRDEDTGIFWTPTPLPIREQDAYRIRHGQGYSVFEHNSHAIEQTLTTFVPMYDEGGDPIRAQRLRLRNASSRMRRLTITSFADLTLGADRSETQMHIITNWDSASSSIFARNAYHPYLNHHITFASMNPAPASYTGDRRTFIGRNRSLESPAALQLQHLPRRSGAGLDPCLALQTQVVLRPGETTEVILILGQASSIDGARSLISRYRDPLYFDEALASTRAWWEWLVSTIRVETPDQGTNFLLNRWLLYQTLSCRIWGRTGFYQSSGALGFRDQLQDTMALVWAAPGMVREHLLKAASRQFVEGDVQHWWHESTGAGVRTRCSDDMLWLPFVTSHYIDATGDLDVLEARVPFLEGASLGAHEHESYFVPNVAIEDGSLFEHCRRAIERASQYGPHGLPLIGSGDWNDGLSRVGIGGQGESVWLAWFLADVLARFSRLCEQMGRQETASCYQQRRETIIRAIERSAWDGEWYARAFFDDGTPLGSQRSNEARIDSLPQSWATIAGGGDAERARRALEAADRHLVEDQKQLVLLYKPPLERFSPHPGYIIAYPPGVRENGGQYTHGSLWLPLAHARAGNGKRAVELLKLMSPIEHTSTREDMSRYQGEPYVTAGDVWSMPGREGQAGWTWYTGSSAWMYRIWIEEILGFKVQGDRFRMEPCVPPEWKSFNLTYRYRDSSYIVTVENPQSVSRGVCWIEVNGSRVTGNWVPLVDNGRNNRVTIIMGNRPPKSEAPGTEDARRGRTADSPFGQTAT
jgi:cyclic beta-1,2-glucan synthetase